MGYSVFYKRIGSDRERVLNSTSGTLEELNIQGLQPGTLYVVRVVAINQFGAGESSKPMKVNGKSWNSYQANIVEYTKPIKIRI